MPAISSAREFTHALWNYEANFYLPEGKGLALCINTMAFDGDDTGFLHSTPPDLVLIDC